jgi:hypothetical protein
VLDSNEENFPLWDAETDQAIELRLSQYRKSKSQLRDEIKTLTSTGEALRQHVKNQVTSITNTEIERRRLRYQCLQFAALVRGLPSGMVEDAMDACYPHSFIKVSFNEAMDEHASEEVRSARKQKARMDELGETQESSEGTSSDPEDEKESIAEKEAIRTPSPVNQDADQLLSYCEADQSLEDSKKAGPAGQQLPLPNEESKVKTQADQQSQLPEEPSRTESEEPLRSLQEDPQTKENPAKRNLSGSDESEPGSGKPDMQRMKGEQGAVARTKTARSNRWGATHKSSGKEETQSSSTAVAFGMANE